jgi:hypothetical protein
MSKQDIWRHWHERLPPVTDIREQASIQVTHKDHSVARQTYSWQLIYHDGYIFSSDDGSWAEAPQYYVRSLEVNPGTQTTTWKRDGNHEVTENIHRTPMAAFYVWPDGMKYPVHTWDYASRLRLFGRVKFGEWISRSLFAEIMSLARTKHDHYPAWTIYYADRSVVTAETCAWENAPLDRVVCIADQDGCVKSGGSYYFWENGKIIPTNSVQHMLTSTTEIKIGMTSYVNWPPKPNPAYR